MMNRKLVIWDFDGPIVDSRTLALELTQVGYHDVDEHVHRNLFNGNVFVELGKLKKKELSEQKQAEFLDKSYWPRKMEIVPVAGIAEAIEDLARDFNMVINSSSSTPIIVDYLTKNNLLSFFSKIYGNEISSKEEKFEMILQDYDLLAQDCVLITDTLGDVLEAQTLAIPSIVILWGYQFREHFDLVKGQVVFIESVGQLATAVKSHFEIN
jgi:phosphoglycolate phosphatase-like HAD superfamily hydrolase